MPSARESTTVTGTGESSAAIAAPPIVLDISPEMCTDTTASAPASAAARYASRNAAGAGRDVDTGVNERRAAATADESMSMPSACSLPPTTTCSGTTCTGRPSSRSAGR